MGWFAQITGYDTVAAVEKTLRYSLGSGIAFTDAPYCPGGMTRWASATQKVTFDNNGQVVTTADTGELSILNLPRTYLEAGPLDTQRRWAWQNREATLWWAPGRVLADAVLMGRGILEQPVSDLSTGATDSAKVRFVIKDPRSGLIAPLQTLKYGGTNVGPVGVDGTADLKGQPEPVLYGVNSNISPRCVNPELLIYQVNDKLSTIMCVRDGALAITPGVIRANTASLQANNPAPGTYDVVAGAGGTFFRLGTEPFARLTFDAYEGATAANRTHAQIWKRIRMERCGTLVGSLDIGTVDTDAPDEVGFYWDGGETQRDALDELLASLSGFEVQQTDGTWRLHQLKAPSGAPSLNFVRISEDIDLAADDRAIVNLTEMRPNFSTNGAPPFAINVQWGRNRTLMAGKDFLGAADSRLIDKFGKEWRRERAEEPAVWDPVANTGAYPYAPELTINTGYQPGADFVTAPHVAVESGRLMNLYSGLPGQYQVDFSPRQGDVVLPGHVVSLTFPGYNLDTGALFVVLWAGLEVTMQRANFSVLLGFQT